MSVITLGWIFFTLCVPVFLLSIVIKRGSISSLHPLSFRRLQEDSSMQEPFWWGPVLFVVNVATLLICLLWAF